MRALPNSPRAKKYTTVVAAAAAAALLSACTIGDVSAPAPASDSEAGGPEPTLSADPSAAPGSNAPGASSAPGAPTTHPEDTPVSTARTPQEAIEAIVADNPGTGIAVAGGGEVVSAGVTQPVAAWSTAKVPLAIAAERAGVADPEVVSRAITFSDNAAADTLWTSLGGGQQAAQATQDIIKTATVPATPPREGFSAFGQTQWSVADQAEFAASLGCLNGAEPVLAAMGVTDPAQAYGLSTLEGALKKGGWGPGTDGGYEARQMGLVTLSGKTVAVAIYAKAPAGDYGQAQQMLTRLAQQLAAADVTWPEAGCHQAAV